MANAEYDGVPMSRSRKRVKVGIASFGFIAVVVGAFYLGQEQNASPIANAPQSAVTSAAPSPSSLVANLADAPTSPARALDAQGNASLNRAAVLQAIEADGTDSHTQDESIQPATFTPLGQTTKVTRDRYAHVIDFLSGTSEGIGDLTWQINDAVTNISVNHLSPDDIRGQEDVIAAMEIYGMTKSLLGNRTNQRDDELLQFIHQNSTREDIDRAIAKAHQDLKDANAA